ncbi:MAG: type IV conjugative transfer system protein TraL, partial [Erythrobacter sp.]|nr:type IV conjugative transfer system protein TraL [Erythrobacter sp.]MBA4045075.1 type IV conjugative transfer system protein TraL [Erythrobacter sp.]
MKDPYIIPRRLDDPELIGFWTIDEFAGMIIPFTWGILSQH